MICSDSSKSFERVGQQVLFEIVASFNIRECIMNLARNFAVMYNFDSRKEVSLLENAAFGNLGHIPSSLKLLAIVAQVIFEHVKLDAEVKPGTQHGEDHIMFGMAVRFLVS